MMFKMSQTLTSSPSISHLLMMPEGNEKKLATCAKRNWSY